MVNKKTRKTNRHPTRKKVSKPTHTHPMISIGTKDRALLKYLFEIDSRLNIKGYARDFNIPRSTVYDMLERLRILGFVNDEATQRKITGSGKAYMESTLGSVGVSRSKCRDIDKTNLSNHFHKFKAPIVSSKNFRIERLKNCKIIKNKMNNWTQTFIHYEGATITINPNVLIINLADTMTENIEDSDSQSFLKVADYLETFRKAGMIVDGVLVEEGHWARIDDALANFLYKKVNKKYYLDLGEGKSFHIDCSNTLNRPERETDDKQVEENVDYFMEQVSNNKYDLDDLNKLKEVTKNLSQIQLSKTQDSIESSKLERLKLQIKKAELDIMRISESPIIGYIG